MSVAPPPPPSARSEISSFAREREPRASIERGDRADRFREALDRRPGHPHAASSHAGRPPATATRSAGAARGAFSGAAGAAAGPGPHGVAGARAPSTDGALGALGRGAHRGSDDVEGRAAKSGGARDRSAASGEPDGVGATGEPALAPFRAGDLAFVAPALAAAARPAALRPELDPRVLADALVSRGVLAGLRVGASARGAEAHLILDPRALGLSEAGPVEVRLAQGPGGVVATLRRPAQGDAADPGLARLLDGLARGLRARGIPTEIEG